MERTSEPARLVLLGQLSLFAFLFVCFLFNPHFLLESNEGGVSNYGVYARTIVPYTLAFGGCGVLTLWAARLVPEASREQRQLRLWLALFGLLYLAVLVTTYPYKINHAFDGVHIVAGVVLLVAELAAGAWFALARPRNTANIALLGALLFSFTLAALTFFGRLHILFIAELATSAAFGALLFRATRVR